MFPLKWRVDEGVCLVRQKLCLESHVWQLQYSQVIFNISGKMEGLAIYMLILIFLYYDIKCLINFYFTYEWV